jgi:hypothetical protein
VIRPRSAILNYRARLISPYFRHYLVSIIRHEFNTIMHFSTIRHAI